MIAANPKSPPIVFLDDVRDFASARKPLGELKLKPRGKILAKTARIDEVRLDLAMFEGIRLNDNCAISQRTPPAQKEIMPVRRSSRIRYRAASPSFLSPIQV